MKIFFSLLRLYKANANLIHKHHTTTAKTTNIRFIIHVYPVFYMLCMRLLIFLK